METRFILTTIFEIVVAAFIIYGLFNEDKFAKAERRAFAVLKEKLAKSFSHSNFQKMSSDRV